MTERSAAHWSARRAFGGKPQTCLVIDITVVRAGASYPRKGGHAMFRRRVALIALALAGLLVVSRGSAAPADDYTIAEGDPLSEIAERFGMSGEELAGANGIVEPDFILSGQVLVIPGAA